MKELIIGAIIVFMVGMIGVKIYSDQQNQVLMNRNVKANQNETSTLPSQSTNKIKNLFITAQNWEFLPSEIRVSQGDMVKLTIKSVDVDHGFAISDFNVKVYLKPNEEEIVEFVADKKGEFTFFCNVICGEGHKNMKGKLIVE